MLPKTRRSSHSSRRHIGKRKRTLILISVIAYAVILAAIIVLPKLLDPREEAQDIPGDGNALFDNAVTYTGNDGRYRYREEELDTLLLIGVDREGLDTGAKVTARSNTQADFLLLAVMDRSTKTLTPIQIDRDSVVPVDVYGVLGNRTGSREMQICLAQGFGKTLEENCRNTAKAVSDMLLGIPVDHYIVYDLSGINVINDLLGGVTVTVEDDLTGMDAALSVGSTVTLRGAQAEIFVRSRRFVGDGKNTSRLRRQRAFMQSALEKAATLYRSDKGFAADMISGMEGFYASDMAKGFTVNLLNRVMDYQAAPFLVTPGEHVVSADGFMECHVDRPALEKQILDVCFEKQ